MIRVLLFSLLPVALPLLLLLIQMLTVGDAWPRNIAPASGLKLWGLIASALTVAVVWVMVAKIERDKRLLQFAALFYVMTGCVGWPVWSAGLLPNINGMSLGPEKNLIMRVERTEVARPNRRGNVYHWAWFTPAESGAELRAGLYFLPKEVSGGWPKGAEFVVVHYAQGLLGAFVVTGLGWSASRDRLTRPS